MNRLSKKRTMTLIVAGILIISFSQIAFQFLEVTDVEKGLLMGFGIGILIVALAFSKFSPASR